MFQKEVVEKIKTYILYSITLFWKSHPLWNNVEWYSQTGHRWQYNMAHVHWVLDN